MSRPQCLGLTFGDAGGIGPEVTLKALKRRWPAGTRFICITSRNVLETACAKLGVAVPHPWVPGQPLKSRVVHYDPDPRTSCRFESGRIRKSASLSALTWINAAIDGCVEGWLDGMVTAPVCKEGFMKAGIGFPGHTELIAFRTGVERFGMMLTGRELAVSLVTRHIPVSDVEATLNADNIEECIDLTTDMMKWMGRGRKPVAVCGLNPHAGDGGAIGRCEMDLISPVIRKMKRRGYKLVGPVAADTVFHQAVSGAYSAVVAMYHDQGLGPLKLHAFDCGVNVTMGLPFVRTSPDHGTAFDIAGTGKADASSMCAAIELALDLAGRRNPWRSS